MADNNKGLQGIPGYTRWGGLSQEEKNAFLEKNPHLKGYGFSQLSIAYDNHKYIDTFGEDAFKQNTSKKSRDAQLKAKLVGDAVDTNYKDDPNYGTIKSLTPEGQLEVLNSKYSEVKESASKARKLGDNEWFKAATLLGGREATKVIAERKDFNADAILGEIKAKDDYRMDEMGKREASQLASSMKSSISNGELGEQEVRDAFNRVYKGGEFTISDEFGTRKVVLPGSNYYKAFENTHEMEEFGLEDMINYLAAYQVAEKNFGSANAIRIADTKMRDYVADHQNLWDFVGSAGAGIGTKMAANIANKGVQFIAWYKRAFEGEDSLANYLEGKDKDGNELEAWRNPLYWNGVDQFGSFSPEFIDKTKENGGISKYAWQSNSEDQRSFAVAVNEGMKMAGYMMSDMLMYAAMAATTKGLGVTVAPEILGALNAGGISQAYAQGVYEQTLQEANQKIDAKIDKDANQFIEAKLSNIDGEAQSQINSYIARRAGEIMKDNPNLKASDINYEALENEAIQQYSQALYQDYLGRHSDDYADDRAMARHVATSAYMIDSITEWARMSLANVTYRKFLMDPGSKAKLAQRYPTLNPIVRNGELASESTSRLGKFKPIVSAIWGGARDNYLDDVNVAWAKAIGLGEFDRYMESNLSPSQYQASTNFLGKVYQSVFFDGVEGARKGFVDDQSFFDGFIGGLGTVMSFYPSGRILSRKSKYDETQLARNAYSRGMTITQYMNSDAMKEDIQKGDLQQRSFAERFSDWVSNPAIQQYGEETAKERELNYIIKKTNEVIANKKQAINDVVRLAGKINEKIAGEDKMSEADIKDRKLQMGFALVQTLSEWAEDPVASQHPITQQYIQELKDASQGKISEDMIQEFLNSPENKAIKESSNAVETARQRIQSNAKQLLEIKESFDSTLKKLNESKDYMAIKEVMPGTKLLGSQLAFDTAMRNSRVKRLEEMNKDIAGTSNIPAGSSAIARYGSEKARQRFEEDQKKTIANLEKELSEYQKDIETRDDLSKEERRALEFVVKQRRALLQEERATLKEIQDAKNTDFGTVLSKQEILALNPIERARMLQEEHNPAEYSEAQRREIKALRDELQLKDPTALDKVKDSGVLYQRLKDLERAHAIMQNNMAAAAEYFYYADSSRQNALIRIYNDKVMSEATEALDNAFENDDTEVVHEAKRTSPEILEKYTKQHPERKERLEPLIKLQKTAEAAQTAINTLFADSEEKRTKYSGQFRKLFNRDHITTEEELMSSLEDLIDAADNSETENDLDRIVSKIAETGRTRNATKVQDRTERKAEEKRLAEEQEKKSNGKYYGWDGYNVGDTIYINGKREGRIMSFYGKPEEGHMKVKESGKKNLLDFTSTKDKGKISKDKVDSSQKSVTLTVEGEDVKATPQESKEIEGKGIALSVDAEGSVVYASSEEQVKEAEKTPEVVVLPTDVSPATDNSVNPTRNKQRNLDGKMIGNTLFKYQLLPLKSKDFAGRVAKREKIRVEGSAKEQFFAWEEATGSDVQAIIDNELQKIVDLNPDTPIRLAKIKGYDKVLFEVVEYTDEIQKIHNEKLGGILDNKNTENRKRYLVVGTLGYNPNYDQMKASFKKIDDSCSRAAYNYFNDNSSREFFVSSKYSTKVDSIDGGDIVDAYNESSRETRSLKDLMSDKLTNPHGMTIGNAVFGIMHTKDKFVLYKKLNTEGTVFSPSDPERNLGLTFIMVKGANHDYIPVSLWPATLSQIDKNSRLRAEIIEQIQGLISENLDTRQKALKNLSEYLVFTKENEIRVHDNKIEIIRDGVKIKEITTGQIGLNSGTLANEIIKSTDFRINITPQTLQNPTILNKYYEAGALRTTAAKLGTVNASYTVLGIDSEGNTVESTETPKEAFVPPFDGATITVVTESQGTPVTVDGQMFYKKDDGKFYTPAGKEVTDKNMRKKLAYQNYIETNHKQPILTKTVNGEPKMYYHLQRRDGSNIIVVLDNLGRMDFMTDAKADEWLSKFNEDKAEKERKANTEKALKEEKKKEEEAKKQQEEQAKADKNKPFSLEEAILGKEEQPLNVKDLDFSLEDYNTLYGEIARSNGKFRQLFNELPEGIQEILANVQKAPKVAPEMAEGFKQQAIQWAIKNENHPIANALLGIVNPKEAKQSKEEKPSPKPSEEGKKKEVVDAGIATDISIKEIEENKKKFNFERAMRDRNSGVRKAVLSLAQRKGKTVKSTPEAIALLKELKIDYEVSDENVLIDMINNCK